jgi:hypothetical protein
MNLKDFNDSQRRALLDLAMLAMYADGHLAAAEDERVHRLLSAMGFTEEFEHNRQYDAAVARVSRHSETAAAARDHAVTLAKTFTTPAQRKRVHEILDDLLTSDSKVAPQESGYLAVIREAFQM